MDTRQFRPTWIEIDLRGLDHNIKEIKKQIGSNCELIGILKGDAYGHGIERCAQVMVNNGVRCFAVSMLEEALKIRDIGIDVPIIIFTPVPVRFAEVMVKNQCLPILRSIDEAACYSKTSEENGMDAPVVIGLDTGMGRFGFPPNRDSIEKIKTIASQPGIKIQAVMTHFPDADGVDLTFSYHQLQIFNDFCAELEKNGVKVPVKTIANSPSVCRMPESYLDAVRPGCLAVGLMPNNSECSNNRMDLWPLFTTKTRIVFLKRVPTGTTIGYEKRFITKRESVIATLPIGYADGYSRGLQEKGTRVLVRGHYAPVLGIICMDQCMIDVTDIPDVAEGDEVVVLGKQGDKEITLQELNQRAGISGVEIWENMSRRIPRHYIS